MLSRIVAHVLPFLPRALVRRIAWRYVAGANLAELLEVVRKIHADGICTTVDVLGENTLSEEEVSAVRDEYLEVIDELSHEEGFSQVSVKPTHVGLRIGEDLAAGMLEKIVVRGEEKGVSVALDMEDSSTTDATFRLFRDLRARHEGVSVAVQAYLERSEKDIEALLDLEPTIRVCKGIYREDPQVTIRGRQAVRESFLRLVEILVKGGGRPAIATHDPWLVDRCLALTREKCREPDSHEFQMLLGVGHGLRPRIRAAGSRLRIYCPFGSDWHAYSLRRLKENPEMVGYVVKGLLSPRAFRWREH